MSLLANSNAIESGGYNIDRSLRFRSSASANLTRTPSATSNRKTWTWSAWVKRGALSQAGTIWGSNFSAGGFGMAFGNYGGAGVNPEIIGVTLYAVGTVTTAAVFRDPSAWYHIVAKFDSTQATQANRFALYVNGIQQTLSGTLNVTLNADYNVNLSGALHVIGGESTYYNDLYMAEVNFIDGQALTPSSFGEFSTETGVWVPKKYTGTYGTNGFYLDFKDNTSATTLAYDKSGNGNNWTPNNISTTAGATYDSMTDVPTLTSATAANFSVLSPLMKNPNIAPTNANLTLTANTAVWRSIGGTMFMTTGKWYAEIVVTTIGDGAFGLVSASDSVSSVVWADNNMPGRSGTEGFVYFTHSGQLYKNSTVSSYGSSLAAGDILALAFDADAGTATYYKNGTSLGTAYSGLTASGGYAFCCAVETGGAGTTQHSINFGQRPFSYTPPTGFKALNTFNLPDPTIKKPNQYMDATTYTGNGTTGRAITNSGSAQPDLVWVKSRSSGTYNELYDSVRGASKRLFSNDTAAEADWSPYGVTAFNSNGFSVSDITSSGYGVNENGVSYVGWQWKESATAGFDIVTYTGNGGSNTVNHSLGVAPSMLITKQRNTAGDWCVYTKTLGWNKRLVLNATAAADNSGITTDPTSTSFYWNASTGASNTNGTTYVAYLFAEIPGFSKFGSYTGNGSTDGPFVYCGFRPKYVMIKRTDSADVWNVLDSARNSSNVIGNILNPNNSNAEGSYNFIDFTSNGFKLRDSAAQNVSNGTYIFCAFAENPFKYSNAR